MARIRTIKPEFPQSESIGRLSRDARLLFILLWTIVDDSGKARANSRMLASLLYPYDDDARRYMDKWLQELIDEKCIVSYKVGGDSYLMVRNWAKHQKIDKPSGSKLPDPPSEMMEFANIREDSRESSEGSSGERNGKEGNGKDSSPKRERENGQPSPEPVKRFIPPSEEIVEEYLTERGWTNPKAGSQEFVAFYQSKGWKVGANPMKDWKAAVVTWEVKAERDGRPLRSKNTRISDEENERLAAHYRELAERG